MNNLSIRISIFSCMIVLFSSCMMMTPGHMNSNNHYSQNETQTIGFTDIVCGQHLEPDESGNSYQYSGITYYFHSYDCREEFRQTPESYINNNDNHHDNKRRNGLMWGLGVVAMGAMMLLIIL